MYVYIFSFVWFSVAIEYNTLNFSYLVFVEHKYFVCMYVCMDR